MSSTPNPSAADTALPCVVPGPKYTGRSNTTRNPSTRRTPSAANVSLYDRRKFPKASVMNSWKPSSSRIRAEPSSVPVALRSDTAPMSLSMMRGPAAERTLAVKMLDPPELLLPDQNGLMTPPNATTDCRTPVPPYWYAPASSVVMRRRWWAPARGRRACR